MVLSRATTYFGRDEREISLRHTIIRKKFVKDQVALRDIFIQDFSGCRYFKLPFVLHINFLRLPPITESERKLPFLL